ncbi:MAG: metallophosphoesterase, partial [Phycisphaerae bacterium]
MRWIIGDVHGMLRPLETLLAEVRRVDSKARFYFVGDYVNRGPSSR